MLEKLVLLIFCHIIGDYLFQPRFIANTKGSNWYHMFVHCILYIIPFWFFFGFSWELSIVFLVHIVIDSMKARWGLIGYRTDQIAHYGILMIYLPDLCQKFSRVELSVDSLDKICTVVIGVIFGVLLVIVLDIGNNKEKHKLEMEEYYERLGSSPHDWGY